MTSVWFSVQFCKKLWFLVWCFCGMTLEITHMDPIVLEYEL